MLCRIACVLLSLGLAACTDLPPAPGTGGTSGTDGGNDGGSGGAAGIGGRGGSGGEAGSGGGVNACTEAIPTATEDIESETDRVQEGIAIGMVSGNCMMPMCAGNDPSDDPVDVWAFTTCGTEIDVELTWTDMTNDLDLYLLNSSFQVIGSATSRVGKREILVIDGLSVGGELLVEVQAYNTSIAETYNLTVTPK